MGTGRRCPNEEGCRELTDVDSDQQNSGLEARLVYDRQTAARLGITPQLMDTTLYSAFGQSQVSTMYTSLNQYHVVMEVAPRFWQDPQALNYVYIHSSTGKVVPLGAVAHFEKRIAPLAVNHDGQFPAVTIAFNLAPGVALSDAVQVISQAEQNIGMPASIRRCVFRIDAGLPGFAFNGTLPDCHRASGGLYRAGNAL